MSSIKKNKKNQSGFFFFRKWRLSKVMFHLFGKKISGKCWKASRSPSFEVKRDPKTSKDVKLNALQNTNPGFFIFDDVPKVQNFDYSKINAKESKIY